MRKLATKSMDEERRGGIGRIGQIGQIGLVRYGKAPAFVCFPWRCNRACKSNVTVLAPLPFFTLPPSLFTLFYGVVTKRNPTPGSVKMICGTAG